MELPTSAAARFTGGYSCSQAVFSTLAERLGLAPETSLRIAAGFGAGIARSGQTCGCVTGALMAIGMTQSSVTPEDNATAREQTYALCQRFLREFGDRNGSTACSALMGCDMSTLEGRESARRQGLFRSLCPGLVESAVEIASPLLATEPV